MARAENRTTKTRSNFKIHKSPKKRAVAATSIAKHASQLVERYRRIKAERRLRLRRLFSKLVGSHRRFAGQIIVPALDVASQSDKVRLKNIRSDLKSGKAAVYWVDGSEALGFLGAGVVWQEDKVTQARAHKLGRNTFGCSGDAELSAIAAAMHRAKRSVRKGGTAKLVRIYSDARMILEGLNTHSCSWIGTLQDKKSAIEVLYDDAEWLVSHNVRVELVWVKGHSKSEGNRIADKAAYNAVKTQHAAGCSLVDDKVMQQDMLERHRQLGPDWSAECTYRLHRRNLSSWFTKIRKIKGKNRTAVPNILKILEVADTPAPALDCEQETDSGRHATVISEARGLLNLKEADSYKTRVVTGRNPVVLIPAARSERKAVPCPSVSMKRTYSKRLDTHRIVDEASASNNIYRTFRTKPLRSCRVVAGPARCISSLLIWGEPAPPCVTRLRTRSRLDAIE